MHRVQHRWSQCAPFRNLLLLLAIAPVAHAGMDATAATMQAATDCSMEATRPGPARLGAPGEVDGDRAAYAADEEPSDPCLITVSEAWTRSQAGDAVIVDVRPPLDFERYRIARSFNIPLYAIKVKPFLRHQGLILVNEGRTPRELVRACHALRTLGFDQVAVMHGGLRAWWQAQQPIVGDHAALAELHRLQPQELY